MRIPNINKIDNPMRLPAPNIQFRVLFMTTRKTMENKIKVAPSFQKRINSPDFLNVSSCVCLTYRPQIKWYTQSKDTKHNFKSIQPDCKNAGWLINNKLTVR